MAMKPHILSVPDPVQPVEWKKIQAACGETVKDARPVVEVFFESKPGQTVEALRILFGRCCSKCLKTIEASGWKRYSYGIRQASEAEELRREMESA